MLLSLVIVELVVLGAGPLLERPTSEFEHFEIERVTEKFAINNFAIDMQPSS